ncbi:hypothetical protein [Streptosporangium amethystogenes]|uniref:hypothetical protein n=1 Tax=Streptosporangium amethystogenes TaxID=2002 RepID=UPI0004C5AA50|nr:hypothetical protein [Streptosporangium amethystogenes]
MRKSLQLIGFIMILEGLSGTIDQIAVQPVLGVVLNFFNRVVVNNVAFLEGYEIYANLILAVLGIVVTVAAERAPAS